MQDTPDTCGRKSYPERKSWGFKHIRIRVDGAKEKNRVRHSVWNNKKDFRFFTGDLVNNASCPPSHEIKRHTIEIQGGHEEGCCPEMGLSLNRPAPTNCIADFRKKYPTSKLLNYGERSEKRGNAGASGGGKRELSFPAFRSRVSSCVFSQDSPY